MFCCGLPRLLVDPLLTARRLLGVRRDGSTRPDRDGAMPPAVASGGPPHHSPSHIALDAGVGGAQDAGCRSCFHVGGHRRPARRGLLSQRCSDSRPTPRWPRRTVRSGDYMGHPAPTMQTRSHDDLRRGLDRFPQLRIGVIEQGAIWMPAWKCAKNGVVRSGVREARERLGALAVRCARLTRCRRQVAATPYPTGTSGLDHRTTGEDVWPSRSDYPRTSRAVAGPVERCSKPRSVSPPTACATSSMLQLRPTGWVAWLERAGVTSP